MPLRIDVDENVISRLKLQRHIGTRKQRTDVGKYSFVNRTIRNWNRLPAGVLATFPCKLNTFRKRIRNPVACRGMKVGNECD